MSNPPSRATRRILVDGVPVAPAATGPAAPAAPATPPPPWKRGQAQAPAVSPDASALESRIASNADAFRADVTGLVQRLAAIEGAFAPSRDAALASAAQAASARIADADAGATARRIEIDERLASAAATARDSMTTVVGHLAPGAAAADWTTAAWTDLPVPNAPADFCRFGTVDAEGAEVPAILPLQPGRGWYVSGDRAASASLVYQAVLRLVGQTPVPNIVVESFDPRATALLAPLSALRSINGAAFAGSTADSGAFTRRLDEVIAKASQNAELVVSGGARSLTELWRGAQSPEGTLTVVTVLGYPYGVDTRMQESLARLAELGPTAGVVMLIQEDATVAPAREVDPAALREALQQVATDGREVVADGFPETVVVRADGEPTAEVVAAVFADAKARASGDRGPSIPLTDLIGEDLAAPWTRSSAESLDATIGRVGREPLVVSFRTQNPPHPNLLAGGQVGTGKSTLLLDVIYSLAIGYSPDELELLLLDFKQGVEFNVFGPDENGESWLPHASVLCLESNQEFGLAVLRHVVAELERRAELFKAEGGVSSIVGYREAGHPLPRMLLIIDEFHELFVGADDDVAEAVQHLETIARQGRSAGVHLLLSSQTTSGITALGAKGDAIFAQFPLRISLKNSPEESEAILARQNRAAADLTYRGEVVVNRESGRFSANERGTAAYVDRDYFGEFQRWMWEQAPGRVPKIFSAKSPTRWDLGALTRLAADGATLRLWAGQPIAVTDEPAAVALSRDLDQSVAIVGADQGQRLTPGLVAGLMVSAAQQLGADDEIVVLTGGGEAAPDWLAAPRTQAEARGIRVRHVGATEAAGYLTGTIAARTREDAGRILLVALAIPQIPGLHAAAAPAPDYGFSMSAVAAQIEVLDGGAAAERTDAVTPPESAAQVLGRIAREGALLGVHLVGGWPNVAQLTEMLSYNHSGIRAYLTVGLGTEDLSTLSGEHRARMDGSPRVGLIDRGTTDGLVAVVPFEPWNPEHSARMTASFVAGSA